jgi:hypothetical protein
MTPAFASFGAQALHYFQREHEAPLRAPLDVAAAWRGPEMAARSDWIVHLDAADVAELEHACAAVQARGLALGEVRREDFRLEALGARVRAWRDQLLHGRGFLLVRGLPVGRWGEETSALAYWGLGQHLGTPGAQNPEGELLGHVVDTGEDAANPFVRRYRTAGDIRWHCDLADAVGLLCLQTAPSGGASRIASSVSVYNRLLAERPDLVERLYDPFLLDTRDEEGKGRAPWVPVPPCRFARGTLRTFWHGDYFRSVERHAGGAAAHFPRARAARRLRGDRQLPRRLPRHAVRARRHPAPLEPPRPARPDGVRGRPDPSRRRHLLRLWLSL